MMKREKEKIEGRIEFDVLVDGKYQKRVDRGILFEDKMVGGSLAIRGNELTVFKAILSLQKHIEEENLVEKFEAYKRVMTSKVESDDDADKFMKAIDLLLEDMK